MKDPARSCQEPRAGLEPCRACHSLQLCEANSRRSRSFSWKLTKVVSLLVRILASEKRFKSRGACQGDEGQRRAHEELPDPPPAPLGRIPPPEGYEAPGSWGTSGC